MASLTTPIVVTSDPMDTENHNEKLVNMIKDLHTTNTNIDRKVLDIAKHKYGNRIVCIVDSGNKNWLYYNDYGVWQVVTKDQLIELFILPIMNQYDTYTSEISTHERTSDEYDQLYNACGILLGICKKYSDPQNRYHFINEASYDFYTRELAKF